MTATKMQFRDRVQELIRIPAGEIENAPWNYRKHPARQREIVEASIRDLGFFSPPEVYCTTDGKYRLVDGELRSDIVRIDIDPRQEIPVIVTDFDEAEAKTALTVKDASAAYAEADKEILDALLREVSTGEAALQAMLSDLAAQNDLYLGGEPAVSDDQDCGATVDETVEPTAKLGDIWQLGEHLIACIDSADERLLSRLCGDAKIDFVWADPPYGIEIVATNGYVGGGEAYNIPFGGRKMVKGDVGGTASHIRKTGMTYMESNRLGTVGGSKPFGSKQTRGTDGASNVVEAGKYFPVIGDDSTDTAVQAYMLHSQMFPDAVHIWWGGNYYANALPPSSCWIVWDKENTGNFADCELAWTNQNTAVRMFRHRWNGMLKDSEHGQRRIHPTQKPVALAQWAFEKYGSAGDTVFDGFLGSGISVIAGERLGRKVIACELSPHYIDAVCARFTDETGREAKLLERIN